MLYTMLDMFSGPVCAQLCYDGRRWEQFLVSAEHQVLSQRGDRPAGLVSVLRRHGDASGAAEHAAELAQSGWDRAARDSAAPAWFAAAHLRAHTTGCASARSLRPFWLADPVAETPAADRAVLSRCFALAELEA